MPLLCVCIVASYIETSCDHSQYQLALMKRLWTPGFDVHTSVLYSHHLLTLNPPFPSPKYRLPFEFQGVYNGVLFAEIFYIFLTLLHIFAAVYTGGS